MFLVLELRSEARVLDAKFVDPLRRRLLARGTLSSHRFDIFLLRGNASQLLDQKIITASM